jgi:hypothetical protein
MSSPIVRTTSRIISNKEIWNVARPEKGKKIGDTGERSIAHPKDAVQIYQERTYGF